MAILLDTRPTTTTVRAVLTDTEGDFVVKQQWY